MTATARSRLLFWSAVLALFSAIPLIVAATGRFPASLNEGVPGLLASTYFAITTLACLVITVSMFVALFRERGPVVRRVVWLVSFFAAGWLACAIYYFLNFRQHSGSEAEP